MTLERDISDIGGKAPDHSYQVLKPMLDVLHRELGISQLGDQIHYLNPVLSVDGKMNYELIVVLENRIYRTRYHDTTSGDSIVILEMYAATDLRRINVAYEVRDVSHILQLELSFADDIRMVLNNHAAIPSDHQRNSSALRELFEHLSTLKT
jgi:hypothetical protein